MVGIGYFDSSAAAANTASCYVGTNWRCFAFFPREHGIETFGHQVLAHARDHGEIGVR